MIKSKYYVQINFGNDNKMLTSQTYNNRMHNNIEPSLDILHNLHATLGPNQKLNNQFKHLLLKKNIKIKHNITKQNF